MVSVNIDRKLYPFEGHSFPVRAAHRMHYLDEGQGPVLLALHGNPTWSFYYRGLVQALRSEYRLVVPDHLGCGLSDKPDDADYSYRLEQRVEDIERLAKHLDLQQITLVLHDWGGMIGLAFAARNPERIARIVLMNSAGFPLPSSKPFPWPLTLSRAPVLGPLLIRGFNAFALTASWVCCQRQRLSPVLRRAYRAPYSNWENRRAVHRFVQDIPLQAKDPSWDLVNFVSDRLSSLQTLPMQIIWGEKDFVFDRHFLAEWRKRMPHAEIHSYRDAGHYVLEDLGDEAITLIRSFLDRHPLTLH